MEDEIHIPALALSGLTMYLEPVKGGGGKYNYDVVFENIEKYGRGDGLPDVFDGHFSWKELHEDFAPCELFLRADAVYKN